MFQLAGQILIKIYSYRQAWIISFIAILAPTTFAQAIRIAPNNSAITAIQSSLAGKLSANDTAGATAPIMTYAKAKKSIDSLLAIINGKINAADTVNAGYIMTKYKADSTVAVIKTITNSKLAKNADSIAAVMGFALANAAVVATNTSNIASNTTAIAGKINISDSNSMLLNYRTGINANAANILLRLLKTDTASMLDNYRSGINNNLAAIITANTSISGKLNKTDTALMLLPYAKTNLIPTTTSQLTNNSGFITSVPAQSYSSITGKPTFASVATTGSYNDLSSLPTIPTNNNQLTNGAGYLNTLDSFQVFTSAGRQRVKLRKWFGIISPTSGSGYSVDISSAGFTTILSVQAQGINNTATVSAMPLVNIKSYSSTAVLLNILQSNSTTVSVLGTSVAGLLTATTLTGITISLEVTGY